MEIKKVDENILEITSKSLITREELERQLIDCEREKEEIEKRIKEVKDKLNLLK